jgi:serine/threonine-protein kinase
LLKIPNAEGQTDRVAAEVVGKTVGGCRILYKIGGGGMGGVFMAHHLALDIPVAVKILHSHLAEKDPIFIQRFIREARSTAKLQHPNIVGVMNVGHEGRYHFLVMPYVGGGSAASVLARSGRFSLEKVLDIGIQMAKALTVAEELNILHRDIKPANILFTEKGYAKLSDLGLAKNYDTPDSAITQTGIACGTPLYFSPEQAKGSSDLDIRSDIYSLGITLYHLLQGSPPFTGESAYVIFQKHVHDPLPPFEDQTPPVPDSVFRLLKKMAEKDREDRFANAQELLDALEALKEEVIEIRKSPSKQGILQRLGIKRSD